MSSLKALLRGIKMRLLPPSSRSFHDASARLGERIDGVSHQLDGVLAGIAELSSQIGDTQGMLAALEVRQVELAEKIYVTDWRIQRQTNWMYDEMERHARDLMAREAHALFYLEELYRSAGEQHRDTVARLFAGLPDAEGDMRVSQLATVRLMGILDEICESLGIDYWLVSGGLVAATYRQRFIPWDDDIDIGMQRADVERLREFLEEANSDDADDGGLGRGCQVTVIYDCIVKVRQVRFSLMDESVPCFIDIVSYDRSACDDLEANIRIWDIHNMMVNELEELSAEGGPLEYWSEHEYVRGDGSGTCAQVRSVDWDGLDPDEERRCTEAIERVIGKYQQMLVDEGLAVADGDDVTGTSLLYGIDNLCEVPTRPFLWEEGLFLPTRRTQFEGYELSVPNRSAEVCDINYRRATPYLPNDIFGHSHFARGTMAEARTVDAMRRFAEGKGEVRS